MFSGDVGVDVLNRQFSVKEVTRVVNSKAKITPSERNIQEDLDRRPAILNNVLLAPFNARDERPRISIDPPPQPEWFRREEVKYYN